MVGEATTGPGRLRSVPEPSARPLRSSDAARRAHPRARADGGARAGPGLQRGRLRRGSRRGRRPVLVARPRRSSGGPGRRPRLRSGRRHRPRSPARLPRRPLVGLDAGPGMLGLGRARLERAGAVGEGAARGAPPSGAARRPGPVRQSVVSNSLLHHLPIPAAAVGRGRPACAAPGAVVHVVDLCRPADDDAVDALVGRHASGAPEVLVADFRRVRCGPPTGPTRSRGSSPRPGSTALAVRRTIRPSPRRARPSPSPPTIRRRRGLRLGRAGSPTIAAVRGRPERARRG